MRIIDVPQLSPEWFTVRCGVPSSSNFDKIFTSKGVRSKQAEKYMYKLAGEAIIEASEDTYQSTSMLRGIETQSEAISMYEIISGNKVNPVGFCLHDCGAGCSPDGFVGDDGMIEVKCPALSTHVEYLLDGKLPTDYVQQVFGSLFITGRKWCDFVSYYPSMKPLIIRVERDEILIGLIENEIKSFIIELKETIERIKQ